MAELYLSLIEAIQEDDQQAIFQGFRALKKMDDGAQMIELLEMIHQFIQSSPLDRKRACWNQIRFYTSLIESSFDNKEILRLINGHISDLMASELGGDYDIIYELLTAILAFEPVSLSAIQLEFVKQVMKLIETLSDPVRTLRLLLLQVKLLNTCNAIWSLNYLFKLVPVLIDKFPEIRHGFRQVGDINYTDYPASFVDHDGCLISLVNSLVIQLASSSLCMNDRPSCVVGWDYVMELFGLTEMEQIYPVFFKIFSSDGQALYALLGNLLKRADLPSFLDPIHFYRAMIQGAETAESFYDCHILRNPDGLAFLYGMLKQINRLGLMEDDETSRQFHWSLLQYIEGLDEQGLLGYNPAPLLRQMRIYLKIDYK